MKLKGCIFDLDGVIVDTARFHFLAWKRLASELGFDFTEEHNEALKGVSRMASLEILLRVGGITKSKGEKELLAAIKNEWYVEYISTMAEGDLLPGSIELLNSLRSKGILTAIGSASRNARTILERTKISSLFDVIVDGNKVSRAKPDPEVFLKGAEEMGLSPEYCIVIEDAQSGIEAAIAAGMRCVGIGSHEILGRANLVVPAIRNLTINQLETLK